MSVPEWLDWRVLGQREDQFLDCCRAEFVSAWQPLDRRYPCIGGRREKKSRAIIPKYNRLSYHDPSNHLPRYK